MQAADSTEHREVAEIRIWILQHSQLWVVLAHILGHNTSSFFQETRFGLEKPGTEDGAQLVECFPSVFMKLRVLSLL